MPEPKMLLWLDLETNGTDENEDEILEAAAAITPTTWPFEVVDTYQTVVAPATYSWRDRMIDVVREMHTTNGLLRAINSGEGIPLKTAEYLLIEMLGKHGRKHDYLLSGSGVSHFDRRFIKTQMPLLDKWLQHPHNDVGVTRRQLWMLGREDLVPDHNEAKTHRAMDDLLEHLDEYRHYARIIAGIPRAQT